MSALELLLWLALIVAVTADRPTDQALLVRTCATAVYSFAALSKLNPSWLAGEGISGLIVRREQLSLLAMVAETPLLSIMLAAAVVAAELGIPLALWNTRSRLAGAAIGVTMHLGFVYGAATSIWSALHLIVFNLALVSCYWAFWQPVSTKRSFGAG